MAEQEIDDLVAFLADTPSQERPNESSDWLLLGGLCGLVILIGAMAVAWRGMRQTYVETLRSRTDRRAKQTDGAARALTTKTLRRSR